MKPQPRILAHPIAHHATLGIAHDEEFIVQSAVQEGLHPGFTRVGRSGELVLSARELVERPTRRARHAQFIGQQHAARIVNRPAFPFRARPRCDAASA